MRSELESAIDQFQGCIDRRDRTGAEQVLHDDYALVLVEPARAVMPRSRWLEVLDDYVVHNYAIIDSVVDENGDVAAVLQKVEMSATVLGEDRSGTFVISDIWRRTTDGWKVWRRHSTPATAGEMPGT